MSLSYAGVTLLIPALPETEEWVETHIRPRDLLEVDFNLGQNPPWIYHDWPEYVRIGEVVWPCDASRWGFAHFFAGQAEVSAILAITGGKGFNSLTISEDSGGTATFSMALLPPRPISRFGSSTPSAPNDEPLYLCTFVDKRFFWWQDHLEDVAFVEGTTTWPNVFAALATALGESFTQDAVSANYGLPTSSQVLMEVPAPVAFDRWAYWTGRRVVVSRDGTVNVWNPTTCSTLATAQSTTSTQLSGGLYQWKPTPEAAAGTVPSDSNTALLNAFLPQSVTFSFPEWRPEDTCCSLENNYVVKRTISQAGVSILSGITGDGSDYGIYWPVPAIYPNEITSTPTNSAALATLAAQAATDFYSFQLAFLDRQESGINPLSPDGLHDRIEWLMTRTYCSTHIIRGSYVPPGHIQRAPSSTPLCFLGSSFSGSISCLPSDSDGEDGCPCPPKNAKVWVSSGTQDVAASTNNVVLQWGAVLWDNGNITGGGATKIGPFTNNGKWHIDYNIHGSIDLSGSPGVSVGPSLVKSRMKANGTTDVANSYDGGYVGQISVPVSGSSPTDYPTSELWLQGSTDVQVTTFATDYIQVLCDNACTLKFTIDKFGWNAFCIEKVTP